MMIKVHFEEGSQNLLAEDDDQSSLRRGSSKFICRRSRLSESIKEANNQS